MTVQPITFNYKHLGRKGCISLSIKMGNEVLDVQSLNVLDPSDRDTLMSSLIEKYSELDPDDIRNELLNIADEVVDGGTDDSEQIKESQADRLVALASDLDLFHTPGGYDSECFASFETDGRRETWPLSSKAFRYYLCGRFYEKYEKAPGSQPVQDALSVLHFQALHKGEERLVRLRLAEHEGCIWLDLADADWRAVRISSTGWSLVDSLDVPIRFIRRRGMLPLPAPLPGGSIDELRGLINIPDESAWKLFVAWIVMACRPAGPYPILIVNGEQGSAKSTLCRFARALVDPNQAALRRPPKDERDVMIAASNSWTLAFDNMSGVSASLSDALCVIATNGGFATRALYTDGDEKILDAVRPIMVNGIEDLATRADLMDRAVNIKLPVISEGDRREESDLNAKFEEARPRILGALLDAVSGALDKYPSVQLDRRPRMADFARWASAAESCLGWEPGEFLDAYFRNREESNQSVIEDAAVGPVLVEFMDGITEIWNGTYKDLLEALIQQAGEKTPTLKDWPKTPRILSNQLARLAPSLRQIGLIVERRERTKRGQVVQLEWVGETSSPRTSPAQSSDQTPDKKGVIEGVDRAEDGEDSLPTCTETPSTYTATKSLDNSELEGEGVDGDDGVGEFPPRSNPVLLDEPWQEEF